MARNAAGNLESYGDPFDPSNPRYGQDPFATSSMIDGGMTPEDGWTYRGFNAPKVPEGVDGYYVMTSSVAGPQTVNDGIVDQGQQDTTWRFVGNEKKAPEAAPQQERKADAAPDEDRPTIYDGFPEYIDIARAEDQGRNRMPFVYGGGYGEGMPTYQDVPYDPILALEQVYPSGRNAFRESLRDPLQGEQLGPMSGMGGGMGGGGLDTSMFRNSTATGQRNAFGGYGPVPYDTTNAPSDQTKRSGYYESYGKPGFVGVPEGGYGGVRAPAPFATTYPGTGTGYAAQDYLPTYRAR